MQEVGRGYVEEMSREWIVMSFWQPHAEQGSCLYSGRFIFVYMLFVWGYPQSNAGGIMILYICGQPPKYC